MFKTGCFRYTVLFAFTIYHTESPVFRKNCVLQGFDALILRSKLIRL